MSYRVSSSRVVRAAMWGGGGGVGGHRRRWREGGCVVFIVDIRGKRLGEKDGRGDEDDDGCDRGGPSSSLVSILAVKLPTSPIAPDETGDGVAPSAEVVTIVGSPPKPLSSWSEAALTSFLDHHFFLLNIMLNI